MKSPFYNDIYEILLTKGKEGLPIGNIARQVYNRRVGLFASDVSYDKIYQAVRFFLWSQANKSDSPFISGRQRGWYAIKPLNLQQMQLDFTEPAVTEKKESTEKTTEQNFEGFPTLF